ncbi:insulinase family protein [Simiduia sp. 21SJ11W-1]|uniref:insulinase family protein n=1 Tax=Simiduia sp. 21SJ11W-1 TaxID=2909669 RepID=UPI00209FFD72|nr:insulinase family protein [Simiduia sp. 21SJ11W-1]UTA48764.1 insulinase family protein [Simiduia sp. 21SJ11W-1]
MYARSLYMGLLALLVLVGTSGCMKPSPEAFAGTITKGKPPLDHREYEYLTLANGLRVVVISDPKTETSAAALDVAVGYMGDPAHRAGMAHFLEHMLFMGSEKYPKPGEFQTFVSQHGGGTNAFTSSANTRYFFVIQPDNFETALDRWSQFFSAPLLDPSQIDKEKDAVHAEYQLKLKTDARRVAQVEKLTANPVHPYNKFSVGNHDTLAVGENGELYAELKQFMAAHYTPENMVLAIIDTRSTAELAQLVRQHFSELPGRNSASAGVGIPDVPWLGSEDLGEKIHVKTIQEGNRLSLQFPIPNMLAEHAKRQAHYVTQLLTDKARGGLFDQLKEKGWAHELNAWENVIDQRQSVFSVALALTDEGAKHTDKITAAVFDWLRVIREQGVQEWRFEEMRKHIELALASAEPPHSMGAVLGTVEAMLKANPEDILHWPYMVGAYDPAGIQKFLGHLNPDNVRVVIAGPALAADRYDALYDVHYQVTQIGAEELARWRKAENYVAYQLPAQNRFATGEQTVKTATKVTDHPVPVMEAPGFALYHQQDTEFKVPKGRVAVFIHADVASNSLRHRALANLYSSLLRDSLQETKAAAEKSGMRLYMDSNSAGFSFGVEGYTEKQPELLQLAMAGFKNFTIDPERFEVKKAQFLQQWRDWQKNIPAQQVLNATRDAVLTRPFDRAGLIPEMEAITLKELQHYVNHFYDRINMEVMVYGNYRAEEAKQIGENLHAQFMQGKTPGKLVLGDVHALPVGETLVELDVDHTDSAIGIYYQGVDASFAERARYLLLGQLLREAFYTELRTEQQMGYAVNASSAFFGGRPEVPGLVFMIQSPKAGPQELARRIDDFVQGYSATLRAMDDKAFDQYKTALLNGLRRNDTVLMQRANRYWNDMVSGIYTFDSREQLAANLEKLSREDIVALYEQQVVNADRRLVARSFGTDHRGDAYALSLKDDSICRELPCFTTQVF